MANQARVVILKETQKQGGDGWVLCFQYCRYEYSNGVEELGYRFIWRRPNGNLQGARGQARIPSVADILELTSEALRQGWGHHLEPLTGHGEGEDEV